MTAREILASKYADKSEYTHLIIDAARKGMAEENQVKELITDHEMKYTHPETGYTFQPLNERIRRIVEELLSIHCTADHLPAGSLRRNAARTIDIWREGDPIPRVQGGDKIEKETIERVNAPEPAPDVCSLISSCTLWAGHGIGCGRDGGIEKCPAQPAPAPWEPMERDSGKDDFEAGREQGRADLMEELAATKVTVGIAEYEAMRAMMERMALLLKEIGGVCCPCPLCTRTREAITDYAAKKKEWEA